MSEWLSPGESHTSSTVLVKRQILFDLGQDVGNTPVLTDYPQGTGRTNVPIQLRFFDFVSGDVEFSILCTNCVAFFDTRAFETADTFAGIVEQLALIGLTLGILALSASQGAAFEKHNGANSRAIVSGKSLNIENHNFLSQVIKVSNESQYTFR